MNQNQFASTGIRTCCLSIAPILLFALALGCSGSDSPGKEQKGKREPRKETKAIAVRAAAFSPDAKLLAVAIGPPPPIVEASVPEQRTIQLWEVDSGKLLHTFQVDKPAHALFFGQNGKKLLACHVDKVTIFDVGRGTKDAHNQLGGIPLAILPDGKKILLYGDGQGGRVLELWDAFTGKFLKKFSGITNPGLSAAISPDGKWALAPCSPRLTKTGKIDPTIVQLWDLSKGEPRSSFGPDTKLYEPFSFFPHNKLALGQSLEETSRDGKHKYSLLLLEILSGKVARIVEPPLRRRKVIGLSDNGKHLVICDEPQEGAPPSLRRLDLVKHKELWNVKLPIKEGDGVIMISALSADGSKFFRGSGAGFDANRLRLDIWDTVSGKKLRDLKSNPPQ